MLGYLSPMTVEEIGGRGRGQRGTDGGWQCGERDQRGGLPRRRIAGEVRRKPEVDDTKGRLQEDKGILFLF
jgi:hypothetical protein